jgi:hypothetical protein
MNFLLFAAVNRLWYALPLVVAVSLVYGATRHERARPILEHALRFAWWIVSFMAVLFVLLWLISRWL